MKIITRKVEKQPLTVTIEYPVLDETVKSLIKRVRQFDLCFVGKENDNDVRIELSNVYYIENVERKVFLYTKDSTYRLNEQMTDILTNTETTELVRISRTCILNIMHLREIRQIKNSHLEATLDNGEKIIVSRKYLKNLKDAFRGNKA